MDEKTRYMLNDLNFMKLNIHHVREEFRKKGNWKELNKELKKLKRDVYFLHKASKK